MSNIEESIEHLQKTIEEKDSYISQVVALCDHRLTLINGLEEQVVKQVELVSSITGLCDQRLIDIDSLHQSAATKDGELISQRQTLDKIRNSITWRATGFIRKGFGAIKRNILKTSLCELRPLIGLAPIDEGVTWQCLTDDPQFMIRPANNAILSNKYLWLSFDYQADSEESLAEIFYDLGDGFQQAISLKFNIVNGKVQVKLPIPNGCKYLRFDPTSIQEQFSIKDVCLSCKPKASFKSLDFVSDERSIEYVAQLNRGLHGHNPQNQLVPQPESAGAWLSMGDDPYFNLSLKGLRPGWNMFEVQLESDSKSEFSGKLYCDYGDGFNEAHADNIIIKPGVLSKRVVHIGKNLKALRFDPTDKEISFKLNVLKFNFLLPYFANNLIAKKLKSSGLNIKKDLAANYQAYKDCYSPHKIAVEYQDWIENKEQPFTSNVQAMLDDMATFSIHPKISVVMPTYNTDEKYLRLCIDSVLNQHYTNLELCVADDNSPNKRVRDILSEYASLDPRVKTIYREENGHISKATNSALSIATGDYIALLDHDDELPAHALYMIAKAINENPTANIIYSDEDKIDEEGNRFGAHFKSGWNPDLLYSQNYVSHLGVYKKDIIDAIGGFRIGVEGSQDYDLLLRALKHCNSEGIVHIPHVLYHWRAIVGSTALAAGEKSYTTDAGIKALQEHFADEQGITIEPGLLANTYKVNWPIPKEQPLVSLIIPTYNGYEITKQAIDSILEKTTYENYEILLVDNNSNCPTALAYFEELDQHPKVTVLRYPYPFNYSAINNFAAKQARGSVIGLINNDVEVISPNWLSELVSHALRPDVGCVGAKLYFENDTIQHAGVVLGIGGVAGHSHKQYGRKEHGYFSRLSLVQNYSAVTAAVLLVKKEIFEEVEGLNETSLTVAFNDVDFCLKVLSAGYRNVWTPYAELYHYESISRGIEDNPVKIARFNTEVDYMQTTWGDLLVNDQYYNSNLTITKEDFSAGAI